MDLAALVRRLRELRPAEYGPENIGVMLRDVRPDAGKLAPYLLKRQHGYTRNLVFADEYIEVLVLHWDSGATTPIHDHAGQKCWFVATTGNFDVENYRRTTGGYSPGYASIAAIDSVKGLSSGEPDYRYGDEDIHRVTVSEGCAEAVSIHVYTRPLVRAWSSMRRRGDALLGSFPMTAWLANAFRWQASNKRALGVSLNCDARNADY
jgi:predicted metal-dependent enzyme (double-stranded beta helix superfamily)